MAEMSATPSCANLLLQTSPFRPGGCVLRTVRCSVVEGNNAFRDKKTLFQLQTFHRTGKQLHTEVIGKRHLLKRAFQCQCMGNIINPQSMSVLEWISVADQMLLAASAAFAFVAGVIPSKTPPLFTKRKSTDPSSFNQPTTTFGSVAKGLDQNCLIDAWDEVQKKLVDVVESSANNVNLDDKTSTCENSSLKHPLSLHAIAFGPRLRLLWATLLHLQKAVNDISESCVGYSRDEWQVCMSGIMIASLRSISMAWLKEEMSLGNKLQKKVVLTGVFEKLQVDDSILWNLRKTWKEDLYADILFFLRFKSSRCGGYYDSQFIAVHAVDILEDLLVYLADRIANIYLELISVDSAVSSEMNSIALIQCSLSTRELQKLRNEVALNTWLCQNIEAVISMYEDRLDLFALRKERVDKTSETSFKQVSWWMKLTLKKSGSSLPLATSHYVAIHQKQLRVKRINELRALTGWLYYFSLYLELFDIMMPILKLVLEKVSIAISFFFVCLIGRSLGLIYKGIRQSLSWK